MVKAALFMSPACVRFRLYSRKAAKINDPAGFFVAENSSGPATSEARRDCFANHPAQHDHATVCVTELLLPRAQSPLRLLGHDIFQCDAALPCLVFAPVVFLGLLFFGRSVTPCHDFIEKI